MLGDFCISGSGRLAWQAAEGEGQLLSFQEVLVLDARYYGLVQSAFFDKVEVAVVLLGMDIQPFIFLSQVDTEVVKERDSEVVAGFAWTGWIKSESRPDVPSRETAIVFVARIGFPAWVKGFLTQGFDEKGSVVWVVAVAKEIRDVKARLVRNSELSKGNCCHLAHFMNLVTIAGGFKERSVLTGFQKIVAEGFFPPISWIKPGMSWRTPKVA